MTCVFGIGGGLMYSGNFPKDNTALSKILDYLESPILLSAAGVTNYAVEFVYETVGKERLYFDSGAYTLMKRERKDTPEQFKKRAKTIKRSYLNKLKLAKFKQVFEMDNDIFKVENNLISPKNFLREEAAAILGYYPTPVFKLHQGFSYWKELCESKDYPTLAIGGLAPTKSWGLHRDTLLRMVAYARSCGKKIHTLGCANVDIIRHVKPDTTDFNIFVFAKAIEAIRKIYPTEPLDTKLKLELVKWCAADAKAREFLYKSLSDENKEVVDETARH